MTALDRRAALAGIGAALLGACAPGSREGAGVADARKDPAEGGIGGTGIVGVLTDFGSLVVNGGAERRRHLGRAVGFDPQAVDDEAAEIRQHSDDPGAPDPAIRRFRAGVGVAAAH
ncbi:MAG: hypothetical protein AAGF90_08480, partial [Pseudomonadota bacterium]